MASQTFEKHGLRFEAGQKYTYNGQNGREWIALRHVDGGGWRRKLQG